MDWYNHDQNAQTVLNTKTELASFHFPSRNCQIQLILAQIPRYQLQELWKSQFGAGHNSQYTIQSKKQHMTHLYRITFKLNR